MQNNKTYGILINAVIARDGKILISKRSMAEAHEPGKWTIPGGKVENYNRQDEIFNIIETTLTKEISEEVGISISSNTKLIANNTFKHSLGHIVLVMVFLCEYQSGDARALDDTSEVAWINSTELSNYDFAPNVKDYLARGFALLPFLKRQQGKNESN